MRRGQAALEFLSTYGWAIMVVMVMIGAISYYGVLNPSTLLPEKCITSPNFSCQDFTIQGDVVKMQMGQGVGKTIYVASFECEYEGETSTVNTMGGTPITSPDNIQWSPRDTVEFTCGEFTDLEVLTGEKARVFYELRYRLSETGFIHTVEGELLSEVR